MDLETERFLDIPANIECIICHIGDIVCHEEAPVKNVTINYIIFKSYKHI